MTDDTAHRGYPRPHQDHNAADDAMRLRDALDMIDADVASAMASATETAAGRVMLATIAEVVAGGAIAKASTPAGVQAAIEAAIDGLIGAAPAALDTLNELAAALGNDPNLAATLTAAIAAKQPAHANLTTLSGLADVANLAAMAGLAGTADKAVYFTAAGALALMTVTAKARALLASADEAAMRSSLGLGTGAGLAASTSPAPWHLVQMDGNGRLPALDGSQLTGIQGIPVGTTIYVNANTPPAGFVKENGALLLRASYPALWAFAQSSGNLITDAQWSAGMNGAFSTGDGSTTFRIPDSRGEFVRCWDDGRGADPGRVIGANQGSQNLAHAHNYTDVYEGTSAGSAGRWNGNPGWQYWRSSATTSSGGSEARPRNVTKLACIKY